MAARQEKPAEMSDEEYAALQKMHYLNDEIVQNNFSYMKTLVRQTPETIGTFGYKSVGEALVDAMKNSIKRIENNIVKHCREFPDK